MGSSMNNDILKS